MSAINFLCCYCGIFIKKNRNNLKRHEKLHGDYVKTIKCAAQNCEITFQNKSNYNIHWREQHANKKMPDYLNFVDEKPKLKKKTRSMNINREFITTTPIAVSPTEFQLETVIEQCLMREQFFGKLQ